MLRFHHLEKLLREAIANGDRNLAASVIECLNDMNAQVTVVEMVPVAVNSELQSEDPSQDVAPKAFNSLDPKDVIYEELEKWSDDLELNVQLSTECQSVEEALRKLKTIQHLRRSN